MTTQATIHIDSPTSLSCGNEYEVAFKLLVDYSPGVSADADEGSRPDIVCIQLVDLCSCVLEIGGCELDLTPVGRDQLLKSWLAVPRNEERLRKECAVHWNTVGRDAYLADLQESLS